MPELVLPEKKMQFNSLHTHTTFSMGDGFGSVDRHFGRAAELGIGFVAVTEHGGVSSHVQAEIAAAKHGIRAGFGCEFYVTETRSLRKFHQTVIAMNEEGYRNLSRLVTRSYKEGFYQWPTVHTEWLLDPKQTAGLLVLSGCADSWLSCSILGGKSYGDKKSDWEQEDWQRGRRLVERFQSVYGDRYYLETQRFPGLERSTILNQCFAEIGAATGVKIAATADVHYPHPEENVMQRILHIGSRHTVDSSWEYDVLCTYPESDEQIYNQFLEQELDDTEAAEAIATTQEIADRCDLVLPKSTPIRYRARTGDDSPWV